MAVYFKLFVQIAFVFSLACSLYIGRSILRDDENLERVAREMVAVGTCAEGKIWYLGKCRPQKEKTQEDYDDDVSGTESETVTPDKTVEEDSYTHEVTTATSQNTEEDGFKDNNLPNTNTTPKESTTVSNVPIGTKSSTDSGSNVLEANHSSTSTESSEYNGSPYDKPDVPTSDKNNEDPREQLEGLADTVFFIGFCCAMFLTWLLMWFYNRYLRRDEDFNNPSLLGQSTGSLF